MGWFKNAGFCPGKKSKWNPENDMPDQTGRVHVITGINAGIGYAATSHLLRHGATIYGICRSAAKTEAALTKMRQEVAEQGPAKCTKELGEVIFIQGDLADLASIKKAAEKIVSLTPKIDVLMASAGIMGPMGKTVDGHELQFGTNVLGHHMLIVSLLPTILKTASTAKPGATRIVITSSSGHSLLTKTSFDANDPKGNGQTPMQLYGRSKLGNLQQAKYLADHLKEKNVVVLSLHPGNIASELQRDMSAFVGAFVNMILLWPVSYGCINQLYGATSEEAAKLNGAYLVPWAEVGDCHAYASDPALIKTTWDWCEEEVKRFNAN